MRNGISTRGSSRRLFLRGAAGFTLALPILPSLTRKAAAADADYRRFVTFMSVNGQRRHYWPDDMLQAAAQTQIQPHVHARPLSEIQGRISAVIDEGFDPFRSKMSLLAGLDGMGNNSHNVIIPLTGGTTTSGEPGGPPEVPNSIDVVLARSSKFYSTPVPEPVLRLQPASVNAASWDQGNSISVEDGARTTAHWNSEALFNQLFATPVDPPEPPKFDPRERQVLVVDRVLEDFQSVRGSTRIGSEDKQRLDQYMDHMHDLQERLSIPPIDCSGVNIDPEDTVDQIYTNHIDMLVAALACGITRIGTMLCYQSGSALPGANEHPNTHFNEQSNIDFDLVQNEWISRRVLELFTKMDSFVDPNGETMLDNSITMWSNEMGDSMDHSHFGQPTLIAGSAGGRLRTGQFINYETIPTVRWATGGPFMGRPYNQLLTSIMAALGLEPEDWEDGSPGFGMYSRIGHQYAAGAYDQYAGTEREYLPHYYLG